MEFQVFNPQRHHKFYSILLFIFSLIVSVIILISINNDWKAIRHHDLENLLNTQAISVEKSINRSVASAKIIAAWLLSQEGNVKGFDAFADGVINAVGGITNLQLAPNGIVKHIYPLKGHEAAIGHDILNDDKRRSEAKLAILSNNLTLAGPFELKQGGIAIIGRQPVFMENGDITNKIASLNKHSFWGFASTLIRLETVISETSLNQLTERGDYFQLWRNHPDTGEKEIFYSNTDLEISNELHATIEMPNAIWHLNIKTSDKTKYDPKLVPAAVFLFFFNLLLSCVFNYCLKQRK